ncbi:hypothetical protein EJB05_29086, partial [Eragrostis curvula]
MHGRVDEMRRLRPRSSRGIDCDGASPLRSGHTPPHSAHRATGLPAARTLARPPVFTMHSTPREPNMPLHRAVEVSLMPVCISIVAFAAPPGRELSAWLNRTRSGLRSREGHSAVFFLHSTAGSSHPFHLTSPNQPNPSMAAPPRPPPELNDEAVEEVLARFPPDDPALLVRAALVCKRWCRLVSSPGFRRRFRELHRTAPMLGFFSKQSSSTQFVPTSSSLHLPYAVRPNWRVLNSRHGRALVFNPPSVSVTSGMGLIVWDPFTDEQRRVPMPPFDVYSSEQSAWSHPISIQHHGRFAVGSPNVQVKNAVYFTCESNIGILEYHLGKQELSVISLPYLWYVPRATLMTVNDGGLGFAHVQGTTLSIWSREDGPDGYAIWAQRRVAELNELLPLCALSASPYIYAVAIADEVDVVFIWTVDQLFTIDLKSSRVKKVGNILFAFGIVPYVSFYTPE